MKIYTKEEMEKIWEEYENFVDLSHDKPVFSLEAYVYPDEEDFEDEDAYIEYCDECPPFFRYMEINDISKEKLERAILAVADEVEEIENRFNCTLDYADYGYNTYELDEDKVDECFEALLTLIASKM